MYRSTWQRPRLTPSRRGCDASGGLVGLHEVAPDRQHLETAVPEGAQRILGRADDRLLMHVVARVDEGGDARPPLVELQDLVERGIDLLPHELRPRRSVHVDGR